MMKRMFAMAAMAAVCLIGATVFGQGTSAAPAASATECKKSDECGDPTPVCDVAKVCRARSPAEDAAKIRKDKQDGAKADVESAEEALAAAKADCVKDPAQCDSPTATPIAVAKQRLAEAKQAAAKVGVPSATATAVAGKCYDTRVQMCSLEPIRGTCQGSSQILRCPGVLAEIDPLKGSGGGASEARLGRIESTLWDHGKRINAVEGAQAALLDEADRTGARAEEAYAAAVKKQESEEEEAHASSDAPAAGTGQGAGGDVDTDRLAGCVGAKTRFLKRDKRLASDAARHNAAATWCLASLNK